MDKVQLGFEPGTNVSFVVKHSLCHGCGTCEAACPRDAIRMCYEDTRGIYLPEINPEKCDSCTICVQTCPGFELDLEEKPAAQLDLPHHPLIGSFNALYRSYTNDVERRDRASSGGLITELVAHLMKTGRVDGAIVTRMDPEFALKATAYIARKPEELIPSQKSKYCPVPLNRILRPLVHEKSDEKFVFVGLPHHVHGLRLLQRAYPHLRSNLPLVISFFTAHVPSQRATEFILHKNGLTPDDVKSIEYRGGGNPGRMKIETTDNRQIFVPHLHWTYSGHTFPLFFYPVREWLYFDKISEWADIVMGDNWMKGLEEQKGASSVIIRNKAAHTIFKELIDQELVVAETMTVEDLIQDQELRTKLNIYWRLKIWKGLGRKIPAYTRNFENLPGQKLRTFRFALFVMLSEHKIPFRLMDLIIRADYFLRARPKAFFKKLVRVLKMFMPSDQSIPAKESAYKIVLIGGYGHFDIGDEAMPHAIRNSIRDRLGDEVEIMMLSPVPANTIAMHGEKSNFDFTRISHGSDASMARKGASFVMTCILLTAVSLEKYFKIRLNLWAGARAALDEIQSADAILNVGGGNINSVIPSELYRKLTTFIVADILRKPVFLSGQTMGPYYGRFSRIYARFALNKVNMISFRDKNVSGSRLREIGVSSPVQFDAADDAITLNGVDSTQARLLIEQETGIEFHVLKQKLLIVLNMKASLNIFKGQGRNSDLVSEIKLMAKLADLLIENYSCNILLMPTDFTDTVDDRVPHQQIFERIHNKSSVFQIMDSYIDEELIGMIGLSDLAIGARYHFHVFAASRHIPFVGIASGIYQRTKLQGLAALCNLSECYIDHDMEFASLDDIWPSVVHVIENRDEIATRLKEMVPQLKSNSTRVVDEVVSLLRSQTMVRD